MKKFLSLLLAVVLLLMIPVCALEARAPTFTSDITFNGTVATCEALISADKTTDRIYATMELWQGDEPIDSWSDSGTLVLQMEETAIVERNKTYKLILTYSINGGPETGYAIYRTNN